jgi:RNA polymerase sigma-70 factor (ECF subfamily)
LQAAFGGEDAAQEIADEKAADPQANLEQQERVNVLQQAIDSLAENQKIAFTLSKYEDLSYQEIAEVMGTTIPAVESLLNRAKKNLQKRLYDYYKDV